MKYAAVIEYIPDADKVNAARPAHRAYLTSLREKDQLFAAGPFEDGYGALIVYEAPTLEAAEALITADPFHAAGIFVRWTVRPWKVVFHNPRLVP
ncbi:MAG TPA: YciI family protein, partial [Urbifossiella sp.]|nr:YciI family protein [Urbifossiella sp.]